MIAFKHSALSRCAALAAAGFIAVAGTSGAAEADTAVLSGSWSGGGTLVYPSGDRERARCRVSYAPRGESLVSFSATCATASGSVSQSGSLRKTGASSYSGSFFNAQYNARGSIHVSIRGGSQSVSLRSSSGSANLTLHR